MEIVLLGNLNRQLLSVTLASGGVIGKSHNIIDATGIAEQHYQSVHTQGDAAAFREMA